MSAALQPIDVVTRELGRTDYATTWRAMQTFTAGRGLAGDDEVWITEHEPVYTVGLAGRTEHYPREDAGIPVIRTDRGGQITYHGPGQTMVYVLLDLRRAGYGVRELVQRIERGVIAMLASHGVTAYGKRDAPGVYVRPDSNRPEAKIASLGLKVRNGCTYHGVAFNVAMDLAPFACINPCGDSGLAVTDLATLTATAPDYDAVSVALAGALQQSLATSTAFS